MQFLNPLFLFGLITALVPIALHFFRLERRKSISFSDLRFLRNFQHRTLRRILFRQWLILVLRVLTLSFIILAFARPAYQSDQAWGGRPLPKAVAILLDASFYTEYTSSKNSLFDEQLAKLKMILSVMDERDKIAIIPIVAHPNKIIAGDFNFIVRQCSLLTFSEDRANINAALMKAVLHLETYPQLQHEIFLLTSEAGFNWPEIDFTNDTIKQSKFFLSKVFPTSLTNITVSKISFSPWTLSASTPVDLTAKVNYLGDYPKRNHLIRLFIENELVNRRFIDLKSRTESTVTIPFFPKRTGWINGYVESDADNLSIDNKRYFTLKIPENISVTLIESSPGKSYYLKEALLAISNFDQTLSLQIANQKKIESNLLDSTDVLILSGIQNINTKKYTSVLYEFVENGGGLLLFPDGTIKQKNELENFLRGLIPLNLGKMKKTPSTNSSANFYIDPNVSIHPLFADLWPTFPMEKVFFYGYVKVVKQLGMQSLLYFNNGDVAMASGKRGKGQTVFSTFPVDLDWTNLPLSGSFSTALQRLIRELSDPMVISNNYLVGDQPRLDSQDFEINEPLEILSPTGDAIRVNAERGPSGYYWKMPILNKTGIWEIKKQNNLIGKFSVNIDQRQYSPTTALDDISSIIVLNNEEDLSNQIRSERHGKELWQLCIAVALLLLVIELWIGRTPQKQMPE